MLLNMLKHKTPKVISLNIGHIEKWPIFNDVFIGSRLLKQGAKVQLKAGLIDLEVRELQQVV